MSRPLTQIELDLALKLAGDEFPQLKALKSQLAECTITELLGGEIIEFNTSSSRKLTIAPKVLGEGSIDDIDGVPIVLTLLQKDGFIWRLDITKLDGSPIQKSIEPKAVRALGYGNGLTLG